MAQEEEQIQKIRNIVSSDQEDAVKIDQVAKTRGWFRPEDNSPYYPIIQNYLLGQLSLDETSRKLFTPIDEKINAERLDDVNFMDLWHSIIHSARRINFREVDRHQIIVDLVSAFKEHSIPGNDKYDYLYSSLIDFRMACREAYNDQPTSGSSVDIESTAWANLNFFYALLTGKQIVDLSMFAIWAMRQALENTLSDDEQSTAVQKYDNYVPAAAVWAFGGFRVLYQKEEDLSPQEGQKSNPAKGGELWKGKAEFSKERWHFWKERFAEIGKMEDISEATKLVARDAVNAMERAATFEKI